MLLGVLEAALVLITAITASDPAGSFTYLFASLWLRALYGSTRGVLLHTGLVAAAMAVTPWAWALLPGRPGEPSTTVVAGTVTALPIMFLTAVVALHLVRSLFAREQTQDRDAALLELSHRLIGVTDRREIVRLRDGRAAALHAATPWMQALVVAGVDADAVVGRPLGGAARVPGVLPRSVLPVDPAAGSSRCPTPARSSRPRAASPPGWRYRCPTTAAGCCWPSRRTCARRPWWPSSR